MTDNKIKELQGGLNAAFIEGTFHSNLAYKPQFIYNDNKNGQKVFSAIEDELLRCDSFAISVAFITRGGITPLLQTLQELERRGVPGRILTTDYLCFSDPEALDTIASLSNIELRMYRTERAGNGFHTKGYIFQKSEEYRFIIGSSNLTQDALTRNMEWNTKLVSTSQGDMVNSVLNEFNKLWDADEYTEDYASFIQEYRKKYEEKQLFHKMVAEQKKIAKQAKASFERVFGSGIKAGLVSGIKQDYDADFVFATVQTLSKQENLEKFSRDYFEAFIYDDYEIIGLSQEGA